MRGEKYFSSFIFGKLTKYNWIEIVEWEWKSRENLESVVDDVEWRIYLDRTYWIHSNTTRISDNRMTWDIEWPTVSRQISSKGIIEKWDSLPTSTRERWQQQHEKKNTFIQGPDDDADENSRKLFSYFIVIHVCLLCRLLSKCRRWRGKSVRKKSFSRECWQQIFCVL